MTIPVDETLSLQLLEESHAGSLLHLVDANRIHLREWLPWVDNMQEVEHSHNYILSCQKQFEEGTDLGFAIMFRNKMAGRIGIHHINQQNKTGEIGYWLAGGLQGMGIVTRCCTALIRYGFTGLGLNRIVIKCAVGNDRSRAIAEKLNFQKEGILRQGEWVNGSFVDLYQYAMLKEEWGEGSKN